MSKHNPLAGLIGNYGDSDDDSDDGMCSVGGVARSGEIPLRPNAMACHTAPMPEQPPGIHPAPIPHCPWSACYDESSGFTYYWNQQTNAVTWDAPPEYLLALRLAQQQLHSAGSTEVSAEEWQLYQQALAEKQNAQNKVIAKHPVSVNKPTKKPEKNVITNKNKVNKLKRSLSDDEVEKIELITSYHNSDSESEPDTPVKAKSPPKVVEKPKVPHKKPKIKAQPVVEYGPSLPPNQDYSAPIGPEMPPELVSSTPPEPKPETDTKEDDKKSVRTENEDSQDEDDLLIKLKNKAKILEKLGGEIPSELQKIIEDETKALNSPKSVEKSNNIDDLLDEIEKKELPKVVRNKKIDIFDDDTGKESPKLSPGSRENTPPVEPKPLFPSIKNINETEPIEKVAVIKPKEETVEVDKDITQEKKTNLYLSEANEVDNVSRKKLRISNSVLPERKKTEAPAYTTKYSEFIEGFSGERTGLGFSQNNETPSPKNTISYGNGLMFTKGETLNEDKKDGDLDDLTELVELKLKYLNQLQPSMVPPVQEMLIQMQTLLCAFRAGALSPPYWRKWCASAADTLVQHEASAAPPGWTCAFQRSEGRYRYTRESDGLAQWEYPATANMDMDISNTPPHPGIDNDNSPPPPPLPPSPPPAPPPPLASHTPPPPVWDDPPPPGCDDVPPLPTHDPKQGIGDELASFYNDIAALEKVSSAPETASNSPEPQPVVIEVKEKPKEKVKEKDKEKEKEKEKERDRVKKKTKVKISTTMGLKHKSVSNLVAKWQQVAEEIHSD